MFKSLRGRTLKMFLLCLFESYAVCFQPRTTHLFNRAIFFHLLISWSHYTLSLDQFFFQLMISTKSILFYLPFLYLFRSLFFLENYPHYNILLQNTHISIAHAACAAFGCYWTPSIYETNGLDCLKIQQRRKTRHKSLNSILFVTRNRSYIVVESLLTIIFNFICFTFLYFGIKSLFFRRKRIIH